MEPLLRGHPDERPPPLERPLDSENLNINVLISTPVERPPLLKGHFSGTKGWPHKRGSTVLNSSKGAVLQYIPIFMIVLVLYSGYWESLLGNLKAHMARTRLRERHQEVLRKKLFKLKAEVIAV